MSGSRNNDLNGDLARAGADGTPLPGAELVVMEDSPGNAIRSFSVAKAIKDFQLPDNFVRQLPNKDNENQSLLFSFGVICKSEDGKVVRFYCCADATCFANRVKTCGFP